MSHLFATGPFLVWAVFLFLRSARTPGAGLRAVWLMLFAFGTLFLLSMSGVYHLLDPGGAPREVLQRLDHAAIFVLIASTFTAVHGILFRGLWRWGMLLLVWALAATAITLKTVFFRDISTQLGLALYLGLGWLGALSGIKLGQTYGRTFVYWPLIGALAYTAGAIFEFRNWPYPIPGVIGPHEVFHVAVLLGLAAHWYFVWQMADGSASVRRVDPAYVVLSPRDIEERIRAAVPGADAYSFTIERTNHQYVRVRLAFNERHLRLGGTWSGPAQMTLTDTAMYALLFAALGNADKAVTTDLSFHFLTRAAPGDLVAEASFLRLGATLAVIDVRLLDASGALVTQVSGTYALPRRKP